MIYSLPPSLIKTIEKVVYNGKKVSYSWGDVNALHKWIVAMDKKQIERALGLGQAKYPLVWLTDNWKSEEAIGGHDFTNVQFYISCKSNVSTLNENRVENFNILYSVANELIKKLKLVIIVKDQSIKYTEKANFSVNKESESLDIWDSLVLDMELYVNSNWVKELHK